MPTVPRYRVVEFAAHRHPSLAFLAPALDAYAAEGWRLVSVFPWSGPDAQAGDAMVQALSSKLRLVCVFERAG